VSKVVVVDYVVLLRMTESNQPIKQADTIMLNYPLNWNYSVDIMKNDLEFYELKISDRTPAMTWSWFTIGWKWVNDDSKMRSYFLKSYQDYIVQPFKVNIYVNCSYIFAVTCVYTEFLLNTQPKCQTLNVRE